LGLGVVVGLVAWKLGTGRTPAPQPGTSTGAATAASERVTLAQRAGQGDLQALAALREQTKPPAEGKPPAVPEAEAGDWIAVLNGLRAGFPKLAPAGKAASLETAARILHRFAVEPAPALWSQALMPVHNLMVAGLNDRAPEVRIAALQEVKKFWAWTPGRTMMPVEEKLLEQWLAGLHEPVVRCLGQDEPPVRAAAVQCLSTLPVDALAAPALARIQDESVTVRLQALAAFANRPHLLTEEVMLPLLHDPYPELVALTTKILQGRGLTAEQIHLCRLIGHPQASQREAVIPLLRDRTDIDPVVWLIFLSRDPDPNVRRQAVEALSGRVTDEARARLEEIVDLDPSPA
ncbi:MAG: hypothetical protein IRY99_28110, partial [Isosphaeraceae bacterium]|nr:hypothetical protein [Isosphaeraceae bacterium]